MNTLDKNNESLSPRDKLISFIADIYGSDRGTVMYDEGEFATIVELRTPEDSVALKNLIWECDGITSAVKGDKFKIYGYKFEEPGKKEENVAGKTREDIADATA